MIVEPGLAATCGDKARTAVVKRYHAQAAAARPWSCILAFCNLCARIPFPLRERAE